jgi:hypothetical protein
MQIPETLTKLPSLLTEFSGCLSNFSNTLGNLDLALKKLFKILGMNDIAAEVTWYLNNCVGHRETKIKTLSVFLLEVKIKTQYFLEQFLKHPYIQTLLHVKNYTYPSNIVSNVIKNDVSVFVECMNRVLEYAFQKGNFDIVSLLIMRDIVDPSINNCSCIYFAADSGNCNIVKYLLLDKRISHHPNIAKIHEYCVDAANRISLIYLSNLEKALHKEVPKYSIFSQLSSVNAQISHCRSVISDYKLNITDLYFEKEYLVHKMKCLGEEDCSLSWLPNDIINDICRTLVLLG